MHRAFLALWLLLGGGSPFLAPSGMAFLRTVTAAMVDVGGNYDPNGGAQTDAGSFDHAGQAETDAGGNWDPNG